ncbi:hypothetical protein PMIN06_004080 [Paraphaeosphaeria minitans]
MAKAKAKAKAMAETAESLHAAAGARAGMAASFELTLTEKARETPDSNSTPLSPPPPSEDSQFPQWPRSEQFHASTLLEPQDFVPNRFLNRFLDRFLDFSPVDLAGPSSHVAGSMLVNPGDAPSADALAAHNVAAEPAPIAPATSTASMDAAVASAPDALPTAPTAPTAMPPPLLEKTAATDLNAQAIAATDAPFPSLDAPISLTTADMSLGPLPTGPDYPMMDAELPFNNGYASLAPAEQRLSAFARLRFDDGSYYMHTYQIILGRNVQLAHKDMRRLAKVEQLKAKGEKQRAQALLNGGRKRKLRNARSVISEAGGIVTAPIEMMPMDYQQRCQSVASQSHSSGSHAQAAESNHDVDHAPQEMLMQALPEVPYQIDQQVPEDPNDCPLVPIHPQHITDRTGLKGPKGISRQHAKIYYDFDSGNFCLAVMGSNGLYHEDRFLPKGANVELSHGDTIIIGMVEMTFFLPDIALTEEQRNRQESGSQSRPMSFTFENGRGESEDVDDSGSEDQSVNPRHVYHYPVGSEFESDEDLLVDGDMDDLDDEAYSPVPQPKPNLKIKLKKKKHRPEKHSKGHKRKAIREPIPEEPPLKKHKIKIKEKHVHKEPPKEKELEKEKPKEKEKEKSKATKAPTKAPIKAPVKAPAKEPTPATPKEEPKDDIPLKDTVEATGKPKSESPVIIRRQQPGVNIEDLDPDGLITPEMCAQYGLPQSLIGQYVGKRKGPGRPPKDGVMSKRQRSQLIKQGKEIDKARAAGIDPADLPQPVVKPKVARRKESNAGEDDEIRESTEKGDGTVILGGEKKTNKPAKPTRTPSPEMRIEDYTEEQLQRPTSNYVVLIHEAISSAPSGQMNLQQIYNYIEKNYPWYKFKTTTSGWQSSVRHNLGQHDAFVKGDKEGKGYMWRINSNVSIEKERRKRQVSPPQVNAQRPTYYPPPTGYSPYGQPSYYSGMPPQGMPPNGPPRPPQVEAAQPRLPPSMARNAAAAPPAAPAPSPYASPWAGGAAGGNPPNSHPPQPYPPSAHAPPANSGAPSGQYGVLFPTSAPPSSGSPYTSAPTYTSPFATAGQSSYGMPNGTSPYTPYPAAGQPPKTTSTPTLMATSGQASGNQAPQHPESNAPHPSGRYPASTNPDLIRQLEAFRTVYLHTRIEPGEDKKADNAIRAFVTPELESSLTQAEAALLDSIKTIPMLEQLRGGARPSIQPDESTQPTEYKTPVEALASIPSAPTTTAAIAAADAAANTAPNNPAPAVESSQPQSFAPPMTATSQPSTNPASAPTAPPAVPAIANVQAQRPSVEPITPVPGSPAVRNGTPVTRPVQHAVPFAPTDTASGAEEKVVKAETPAPPLNQSA